MAKKTKSLYFSRHRLKKVNFHVLSLEAVKFTAKKAKFYVLIVLDIIVWASINITQVRKHEWMNEWIRLCKAAKVGFFKREKQEIADGRSR